MGKNGLILIFVFFLFSTVFCQDENPDKDGYKKFLKGSLIIKENITNSLPEAGTFIIMLETNPTTGYDWYYKPGNSKAVRLIKEAYYREKSGSLTGAPSIKVWKFRGLKKGLVSIKFQCYRSWEGADKAVKTGIYYVKVLEK